jgi:hypothetical protein
MVWRLDCDAWQLVGKAGRKKMWRVDLLSGVFWNGAELDRLRGGKEAGCLLLFDVGEELFDLLARINDLNGNGEIFSQPFDLEGVDHTGVRPESHKPPVDGGAGQLSGMGLRNEPFIERAPVLFIAFPDIDSQ